MIPRAYITAWRSQAPWPDEAQVEQDLVISRAIVDIFSDEFLRDALAFRGGTALYKLHLPPARYSEDIDLVQVRQEGIGETADRLRAVLDPWLGSPTYDSKHGRYTLKYRFDSETGVPLRLKGPDFHRDREIVGDGQHRSVSSALERHAVAPPGAGGHWNAGDKGGAIGENPVWDQDRAAEMYRRYQTDRGRAIGPVIAALVLFLASEASAQIQMAPGLELSAGTAFDGADPLWMLTDTRAISHEAGLRLLRCFDAPNNNVRNSLAGDYWIDSRLAVHPITGEFYVFSATYRVIADREGVPGIQVARTDCDATLDVLHEATDGQPGFWEVEPIWRTNRISLRNTLIPMRDDGTAYIPLVDGIATWSINTPAAAPTMLVQKADLVDALQASQFYPPGEDLSRIEIYAALPVDDGIIVHAGAIFHVTDGGVVTALVSETGKPAPDLMTAQFYTETGWVLAPELNAVLTAGASSGFRAVGVIPRDRPELVNSYPRPTLALSGAENTPIIERWIGGEGGAKYAITGMLPNRTVHRVTLDVGALDIDGDGMTGAEETALGLDDRAWDHDRDGTSDGAERALYGTDPGDPGSTPTVGWDFPEAGVTTRLTDWEPLGRYRIGQAGQPDLARVFTSVSYGTAFFCFDGCYDASGTRVAELEIGAGELASTVDGTAIFRDRELVYTAEGVSADSVLDPPYTVSNSTFFPLSPGEFYAGGLGVDDVTRSAVWRHADAVFPVIDPDRAECPLAVDAADPRCGGDHLEQPDAIAARVLGPSLDGKSMIAAVSRARGDLFVVANGDRVEAFADARVAMGLVRKVIPMPDHGAYLVQSYGVNEQGRQVERWYLADPNFVPHRVVRDFDRDPANPIGGTFVQGLIAMDVVLYTQTNGQLGTGSSFGCSSALCFSDPGGPPSPSQPANIKVPVEVRLSKPQLEPGDVLLAVPSAQYTTSAFLTRVTRSGTFVEWLRMNELDRLSDGAVQLMKGARSMAVSPDRSRVCIVESELSNPIPVTGNLWEVVVENGVPASVTLAVYNIPDPPTACAYDESGELFWTSLQSLWNHDGKVMDIPTFMPRHLHRVDQQWVVIGDLDGDDPRRSRSSAHCVRDDGSSVEIGGHQAIDVQDGLAYLLDHDGTVDIVPVDQLCVVEPAAVETLLQPSVNVWSLAFDTVLGVAGSFASEDALAATQIWRVEHAAMVVRPDHTVLVGHGDVWQGAGRVPPYRIWRVRGTYHPTSATGLAQFDPLRREEPMITMASTTHQSTAFAKVPGDSDWPADEYQLSAPPLRGGMRDSGDTGDAGASDVPAPDVTPPADGCCATVSHPTVPIEALPVLLALVGWRVRRRREH